MVGKAWAHGKRVIIALLPTNQMSVFVLKDIEWQESESEVAEANPDAKVVGMSEYDDSCTMVIDLILSPAIDRHWLQGPALALALQGLQGQRFKGTNVHNHHNKANDPTNYFITLLMI